MKRTLPGSILALAAVLSCGCGPDGSGTGGAGGTGGTGGSGAPTSCGDETCSGSEVCSWFLWECGEDPIGCSPRPTSCDPIFQPVCGCDGAIHTNACEAQKAGVALSGSGSAACTAPEGRFRCGYTFCTIGEQFCREEFEAGWSCAPLPQVCKLASADCTCLGFMDDGPTESSPPDCNACQSVGGNFTLECGAF